MSETMVLQNGKRLSYRVYGKEDGYPILSFHGLAGTVESEGLNEQLAGTNLRVVNTARPGYGESDFFLMENIAQWPELLHPLFERLEIIEFDVVGISAGAPYAYAVASAFPDRVQHVFINKGLAAVHKPEVLSMYPEGVKKELEVYLKGSLEEIAEQIRSTYLAHLTEEHRQLPYIRDSIVGSCMGMAACGKLEFMDWGFDLGTVMQPVYLFHCRDDAEVPFAMAEKTMGYLPHAEMTTHDTGGHMSEALTAAMMTRILSIHQIL